MSQNYSFSALINTTLRNMHISSILCQTLWPPTEAVTCLRTKHWLLQRATTKLKDPASCLSLTSPVDIKKKAWDRKEIESSTNLTLSQLWIIQYWRASSIFCKKLSSSKHLCYLYRKEKERKEKNETDMYSSPHFSQEGNVAILI